MADDKGLHQDQRDADNGAGGEQCAEQQDDHRARAPAVIAADQVEALARTRAGSKPQHSS